MFVAGFVGSPAMNLVPGTLETDGGQTSAARRGWMGCGAVRRQWPQSEDGLDARRGVWARGTATIAVHQAQTAQAVPGRIYTVEPTGDITYAYVSLGSVNLVVSVPPSVLLAPDDPVWLTFDQERLHLFDGESQQALSAA